VKQTFFLIALAVGLLLFAGGYVSEHSRTAPGMSAPALALQQADSTIAIDRLRGDYVLLCFWSSTDAPSRQAANLYTAWHRAHPSAPVKVVGVNFDDSEALFREIVRRDSLEADNQYHASGDTAAVVARDYGLDKGFGTAIIAPNGKILALNPDDATLESIIK